MIFCISVDIEFNFGIDIIRFFKKYEVLYEIESQNKTLFDIQDTSLIDYAKSSPVTIKPKFFTIKIYGSIKKIFNILLCLTDIVKNKFTVDSEIPSGINLEYYSDILPKNLDYKISTDFIVALILIINYENTEEK